MPKMLLLNLGSLAAPLAQRRAATGVPTSEYIRRCIRYALVNFPESSLDPLPHTGASDESYHNVGQLSPADREGIARSVNDFFDANLPERST